MSAEYYIRRSGSGYPPIIVTARYEAIAHARTKTTAGFRPWQQAHQLLETTSISNANDGLSLNIPVYLHAEWADFQDAIYTVNRRLLYVLASCRLYLDQGDHDLSAL